MFKSKLLRKGSPDCTTNFTQLREYCRKMLDATSKVRVKDNAIQTSRADKGPQNIFSDSDFDLIKPQRTHRVSDPSCPMSPHYSESPRRSATNDLEKVEGGSSVFRKLFQKKKDKASKAVYTIKLKSNIRSHE